MLTAARDNRVKRFVYASSSSVYGDLPELPKIEERIGEPLSPYAATKCVNEIYARVFAKCYEMQCMGLRYFNVFGPRQDPDGAYAAVIPKWIAAMMRGEPVYINGDGATSRDFCYVANVVQANLLAATEQNPNAVNEVYNIAVGERTTLNQLFQIVREGLSVRCGDVKTDVPIYCDERSGDVRHSLADISKARRLLGYNPKYPMREGMREALDWYVPNLMSKTPDTVAKAN
jgi:UDP-N-acetylglucosamine 4-epimerase